MTNQHMNVAIVGVGTMGAGMADTLLRAGLAPALWNRDAKRLAPYQGTQARIADSAADAVRDADIVVTMVTDADAVLDVARDQGMLDALPPGAVWAQMSTIGVDGFDRVAAFAAAGRPDVRLVDAPVTGSSDAAEAGTLTIFASGPDDARDRVTPLFDLLGQRTLWLGPAGLGTRLKLANNTMIAFLAHGLGEALAVAHHLDLTTEAVMAAFDSAAFQSPYLSHKLDRLAHGDYDAEFALDLALKDVKLAVSTLDGCHHPVFAALENQWQQASDAGLGHLDLTAITRFLLEAA